MNSHKNARWTLEGRKLLVERIAEMALMPAGSAAGMSPRTARKWLKRFLEGGVQGLHDRSSRPARTRTSLDAALHERIEQLRRSRMPMRRIATIVGRSVSTVSRLLARLGLPSLKALDPMAPIVRYEREAPGELLHIDTKKLGRIAQPSHRMTGDRRDAMRGAGWECAHVAIDDHSRAGFVQMHANERKDSAVNFLLAGPQTNGKAERFIQTCLRECAYARVWANSAERTAWLPAFVSYYNARRPHSALGYKPPASRLSRNNLLQLNN